MIFENFTFENTNWFWLLLSIPLAVFWYFKKASATNSYSQKFPVHKALRKVL